MAKACAILMPSMSTSLALVASVNSVKFGEFGDSSFDTITIDFVESNFDALAC